MDETRSLPSFDRPPVIETVLGVQFDPLPGLTPAHLGVFWKTCLPDWPTVTDAPFLDPQFETFNVDRAWGRGRQGMHLTLTDKPPFRLQVRNAPNDQMVQVQNGRFHLNWMKRSDADEYPRYSTIRPQFDERLTEFERFIREEHLGELRRNQWEVTYVNHFPKNTVWHEADDWAGLFRGRLPQLGASPGVRLETFDGNWHYEIPPQRGRLHVNLQHGQRAGSSSEVLIMTLTARGPLANGDLGAGLDLGREAIVVTFKELTSSESHAYWGIRE